MMNIKEYKSFNNKTIYVGKDAQINNYLTFKVAKNTDLFFHASDHAGAHVILCLDEEPPTRADILDAATLAAHFSKGKNKKIVKVDYTLRSEVSRPHKAPAGLVEIENFKTLRVKKDPQRLERLLKSN